MHDLHVDNCRRGPSHCSEALVPGGHRGGEVVREARGVAARPQRDPRDLRLCGPPRSVITSGTVYIITRIANSEALIVRGVSETFAKPNASTERSSDGRD